MSELTTAARPYARAVFDIATTCGEQQQWMKMLRFMTAVSQDARMAAVLDSPGLSRAQTAATLVTVCEAEIDQRAKNFIKLLTANDRLDLLPDITALYEQYRVQAEGRVDAQVVSAQEINEAQLSKIAAALKARLGKEVRLTSKVDAGLIGGAIICAGDLVIDGSVRGRLNKLSTSLVN